jgi:hypothetical protein
VIRPLRRRSRYAPTGAVLHPRTPTVRSRKRLPVPTQIAPEGSSKSASTRLLTSLARADQTHDSPSLRLIPAGPTRAGRRDREAAVTSAAWPSSAVAAPRHRKFPQPFAVPASVPRPSAAAPNRAVDQSCGLWTGPLPVVQPAQTAAPDSHLALRVGGERGHLPAVSRYRSQNSACSASTAPHSRST